MPTTTLTIRLNAARSDLTVTPERGEASRVVFDPANADHRKGVVEMVEREWRQRAAQ